jgi:predicted transcriptional regulator
MEEAYVDKAVQRVVAIAQRVKKSDLARRAGVPESTLRDLGHDGWAPNASTLRKLEAAAIQIEIEQAAA